ncbi:hypothetical protein P3T76_006001 [Phytophthora citrophthora]|uniref:Uncharacterized protein n=1 Tax=Phytophthora citrophthora TaxID=4793 RepID=A0AAD9LPA3_9STRA|nr:hypothetical protein P3T76_006001 [Phytophthora citrophthora]
MKEESFKWLPDEHWAALKLVKGESDDYINALTTGEQILASTTLATWFYAMNNMKFPSSEQIHVLVVIPKGGGDDQKLKGMLLRDALMRIQEENVRMWHKFTEGLDRKQAEEIRERFTALERALNLEMPVDPIHNWVTSIGSYCGILNASRMLKK